MDPKPTTPDGTTPATEPVGDAIVEAIRTQRQNAGSILAVLSFVLLIASAVFFYQGGFREPKAAENAEKTEKAEKQDDLESPDSKLKTETTNPRRAEYLSAGLFCLLGFMAAGGVGLWMIGGLPHPDVEKQRSIARMQLLATGGLLGLIVLMAGAVFFYLWMDSLGSVFEKGVEKDIKWVAIPLLMVLFGAAMVIVSVQPARAEERNNPTTRRLVYGSNLALTSMLLLVVLIVGNVVVSYRVSNTFDTTSSGFYSMSPQTEEILHSLDQPILAYAVIQGVGGRQESDLIEVLNRFQDVSNNKFKVILVSSLTNSVELANLKTKYPPVQDGSLGVLLTFTTDDKRFSFIPFDDFFTREQPNMMDPEQHSRISFVGEGRLDRELLFLADNKQKPKVYFTQSSEEMQLSGSQDQTRSISSLQAALEKNYLEVLPLQFDDANPKVPEDCAVLVAADPKITMPPKQVEAIQKYMNRTFENGRKGKLVLLSSALPLVNGRFNPTQKVKPTGLEGLLNQFNVSLHDRFLFGWSEIIKVNPAFPLSTLSMEIQNKRHPLALLLAGGEFPMPLPRVVEARQGSPAFTATTFLATATDGGAWEEETFPENLQTSYVNARRARTVKQSLPVGAIVSEGATGRLVVIGDGTFVSDGFSRDLGESGSSLMGGVIDWLRDRPSVPSGVQAKTYSVYAITNAKTVDRMRLEFLPLGLVLLAVVGIGMGVWITRRQMA